MRIQFTLIALLGLGLANPVLAAGTHAAGRDAHSHATATASTVEQSAAESWAWTEPESVVASAQHQTGIRAGERDQTRQAAESWTWTDPQN